MKNLKSTRPSAALPPDEILRIAGAAAPDQPPAIGAANRAAKSAMLSVRMTEATLEALARYALQRGMTQRRVIAEALASYGIPVAPRDLEDRPLPRRRGGLAR